MKRKSIGFLVATLIAASPILATASYAQTTDIQRIEEEVNADLGMMGISGVDVKMLTLQQLQEIKLVEGQKVSDAEKKLAVEKILGADSLTNN